MMVYRIDQIHPFKNKPFLSEKKLKQLVDHYIFSMADTTMEYPSIIGKPLNINIEKAYILIIRMY